MPNIINIFSFNQFSIQIISMFLMSLIKGSFLFIPAYFIISRLRKMTPDFKHLLWFLVIFSFILIPVFSVFTPAFKFGILPFMKDRGEVYEVFTFLLSSNLNNFSTASLSGGARSALSLSALQRPRIGLHWPLWVMLIWFSGVIISLLNIITGGIGLSILIKKARPIEHKTIYYLMKKISQQMSIKRNIELLTSDKCKLPSTCNIFKPVILFPADAVNWPLDRIRIVLLHELAHIKRDDYLTNLISRLICSLYWFMPLIWIAHYSLNLEQEKACDSSVIHMGVKPVDYAGHIVYFARLQRKHILLASIFMLKGRKKILETRVRSAINQKVVKAPSEKGDGKMKVLKMILISSFILAFLVLFASFSTGSNFYKQAFEKEIVGTWINPDYNKIDPVFGEGLPFTKMIVRSDKTIKAYFNIPSENYATAKLTLTDRWTDTDGNILYKALRNRSGCNQYELWKIRNSGTVWEVVFSFIDYPEEIDPGDSGYLIYYRH